MKAPRTELDALGDVHIHLYPPLLVGSQQSVSYDVYRKTETRW